MPGGVTRIIGSQVKALLDGGVSKEILILCGTGEKVDIPGASIRQETCLGYRSPGELSDTAEDANAIFRIFKQYAGDSIFHFHNPNLGKNPSLTLALYRLVQEGFPVVNHCHDFPEDRPENYLQLTEAATALGIDTRELLYPQRANCHFAVLNGCDHTRLLTIGLPAEQVHLMPNPVAMTGTSDTGPDSARKREILQALSINPDKRIITYPVRAIRRKNLGETILMAILFRDSTTVVVTQPPKNPVEKPSYERWKKWCLMHGIDIKFEAGEKIDHEELIGISDFCITTSLREGFGMVFMEPWLAGTPVVGRNLPCVTKDLLASGMELPGLYDRLIIDISEGSADFGTLDQEAQENVLETMLGNPAGKKRLFELNPFLAGFFNSQDRLVEKNRMCIGQHYSLAYYGKKLSDIYKKLSGGYGSP